MVFLSTVHTASANYIREKLKQGSHVKVSLAHYGHLKNVKFFLFIHVLHDGGDYESTWKKHQLGSFCILVDN